ncbi:MAG TPA: CHASE2 domain-containing protein [Rhizomicrobium sp.]|nr:CHASE2 domain-containing protein [Rhizomicrobium sp.]
MADADKPLGRVARFIERVRRPSREHVEKLKERVPYWFVALVLFGFAVLQIALNPFGFSDLTQRYTQDISNLLVTGPYLYPTTGRDQVTVALVDEETLHMMQMPWPWTYGMHARALNALLAYKPKAVIVDFLFIDMRPDPSISDLADAIRRYQRARIPIYFEGGSKLSYGEAPVRPEIAATGVPILSPDTEIYDGVVRQYPTSGACFGRRAAANGKCLSLALQAYNDLYPEHPLEPMQGEMELVWGTRTAPFNEKFSAQPCNADASFGMRIYRAFFDKQTAMGRCPYNAEVPMQAVMTDDGSDRDLAKLIPGHVVFYGGGLEGAQDKSFSPVNGLQPGVFVHAMALDNLITFEGRPEQNVMTVAGITMSNNPAQVLAIIPIILILAFMHMRRLRRRRTAAHREHSAVVEWFLDKGAENLWHWLAFFLALGVGLALARLAGLSVANWIQDVFISVELAAMLLIGVPDSLWGYLHHVAGGVPRD